MTWLAGQTTQGSFADLFTQLVCGEAADDSGVTVSAAHQWRRIDAFNAICTPASKDVTINEHGYRAGYYTAGHGGNGHCRTTGPYTVSGGTSPFGRRRILMFYVGRSNTVPNNYSDLGISWLYMFDPDRNGGIDANNQGPNTYIYESSWNVTATSHGAYSGNTDGTWSFSPAYWNGTTNSFDNFSMQFGSTTGIVSTGWYWRAFDLDNAPYGVDYIPMLSRRSPGASVSFPTAPPGANGTNWVLLERPGGVDGSNSGMGPGFFYCDTSYGVGWKTAPNGARYTVSLTVAHAHARLIRNGNAQFDLWFGPSKLDAVNTGIYRFLGGPTVGAWLRTSYDAAQASTAMPLQYWIRVTDKGIVVVVNGDPGQAGRLATAVIGQYDSAMASWDPFPWYINYDAATGATVSNTWSGSYGFRSMYSLWAQRIKAQDQQSRDWQHGWGRADIQEKGNYFSTSFYTGGGNQVWSSMPAREPKPNSPDGVWEMWQIPLYEGSFANYSEENYVYWDSRFRGWTDPNALFVPEEGFGSGDTLTDPVTGKVYFLVLADYPGALARQYTSSYPYNIPRGGVAILEG